MRYLRSLALAAGLSLPSAVLADDKMVLILDWYVNPDHAPIILAEQQGFFKDAGLEVEIIAPADPTEPPKLVAAGRADLAVSYQPQLHLQVHQGLPLTRVGTLVATPLSCLMVKADGPIQTLSDLKGRKVGYSVSGVESAMTNAMLADAGLEPSDIDLVNVNWSLTPSLLTGQVDAVIGAFRNFELTQMRLAGTEGRCFFPEEHGLPSYDELIFVANSETLDPEQITRFLSAIEQAVVFMLNHPDAAFDNFKRYSPDLADPLNTQAFKDTLPRFAHSPSALDHSRYARFETFLHSQGLVDEIWPVAKFARDLATDPTKDSTK